MKTETLNHLYKTWGEPMFDLDSLVDDFLTSQYEDQHGDPDLDEDTSNYLEDFELSEYGIDYRHNDPFYSPDPSDMD